MNDWNTDVIEKYDLTVEKLRRGRGAWVAETDRGLMLLKEYKGSQKRLQMEETVLASVSGLTGLRVDQIVRNQEGELISKAEDGTPYIVRNWYEDPEIRMDHIPDILKAVGQLAMLHKAMRTITADEEWDLRSMVAPPFYENMKKYNREMKKARLYIRKKQRKNDFELEVMENFDEFFETALKTEEKMEALYRKAEGGEKKPSEICHGEMNQHHILMGDRYVAVTGFHKMHLGFQIEDLYYFMRKIMEKHDWNRKLGDDMVRAYENVLPMDEFERECLSLLFTYPEKYRKQINFHYNTRKAFIPERKTGKLKTLMEQKTAREKFAASLF